MRKQIFTIQVLLAFLILFGSGYAQRNFHHGAMTANGDLFEAPSFAKTTIGKPLDLTKDYLFYDDFSSGSIDNWTPMGDGMANWAADPSNYAGGSAPELALHYAPVFTGNAYLVSPVINTAGYTSIGLQFKHYIDNWSGGGGVYFRVYTTSDGGSSWNEVWVHYLENTQPFGPELVNIVLDDANVGSSNFQFAFGFDNNSDYMDDWLIDDVALGDASDYDVAVIAITGIDDLLSVGDDVTASANIFNLGTQTVTFDVDLEIDNGTNVIFTSTQTVTDLASGDPTTVTFDTWTTTDEGVYTATVTTLLAGDVNPDNDVKMFTFSVISGVTRNLVILEDFTGTWCVYCPGAALGIQDLLANGYDIGPIGYHIGDAYETVESAARDVYYAVSGYPTNWFDGVYEFIGGSATSSLYEDYVPIVEDRMAVPTPITVDFENVNFDGTTFTADVVCEAISAVASNDLILHAVLTESHIAESWMILYEINDAERLMYNGADGTPIDLINNSLQTVSIQFDLDPTWIPEMCEVVVFVQDESSKEIFNGNKVTVEELTDFPDVTIVVVDNNGFPVEGATVGFDNLTEITPANGTVIFENVDPGVHWYTASKDGYLPGMNTVTVLQAEDKELSVELIMANILSSTDFAGAFPPDGWTLEGDAIDNWNQSETYNAGGAVPELGFHWNNNLGTFECVSPFFDISTASSAVVMFKHKLDDYSGTDYALYVKASPNGNTWENLWEMTTPVSFDAKTESFELGEEYLTAGQVKIKFVYEGDAYQIEDWFIDDVWVLEPITATSVNNIKEKDVTVFPNPAANQLSISNITDANVYLYNISGQLVLEKRNVMGSCVLDISNFENGIYIVNIVNDRDTFTTKVNVIK